MGELDATTLREAVRFLDRYRGTIEEEVDRRMGRREPPPAARREVVRRFRSYTRLASVDPEIARPSLDGLGGHAPEALEKAIELAVDVACLCEPADGVASALRELEARFRTGVRRTLRPQAPERRARRGRRRALHSGRRVRAAIDRIPDAYIAFDLENGRLTDMNPAAEALLGSPAVTLIEKPFSELIAPDTRSSYSQLEARLDAEEDVPPTPLGFRGGDGQTVNVEASVAQCTIGGRRLAILIARETGTVASPDPGGGPERAPAPRTKTSGDVRAERRHRSIGAVVRSLLDSSE